MLIKAIWSHSHSHTSLPPFSSQGRGHRASPPSTERDGGERGTEGESGAKTKQRHPSATDLSCRRKQGKRGKNGGDEEGELQNRHMALDGWMDGRCSVQAQ